jgi:alkanesulfonate monooxygenase SsuD/methylene tetrahydromethanopterin reductase-like flavin-dependent oxidoreductase (luciferase family)
LVLVADDGGLQLVGTQDHAYQRRFVDTFALIATLLAETPRVSLFTDVANLPLRQAAMMATAASSLDVLSESRFEVGPERWLPGARRRGGRPPGSISSRGCRCAGGGD